MPGSAAPPEEGGCEVWARELAGGNVAVGLFNGDGRAHRMTVDIAAVMKATGGGGGVVQVRDIWRRKPLGKFTGTFSVATVASHATEVFLFTPAK
jgi:hypothetical protein